MLKTPPSPPNNDSIINSLNSYRSSSEPILSQPYKFDTSSSKYSIPQPLNKLENIHYDSSSSEMYQPYKRVKHHGKEQNMLQTNKENNLSRHSLAEQDRKTLSSPVAFHSSVESDLDPDYSKLSHMNSYQNVYSNSGLQMPVNQPVDQQILHQFLLQNLYNNTLAETEMLRRYNELQGLALLQNMNNNLLPENMNNFLLLSLYEKQKQDYYNFYLMREARQQLETFMINTNINQSIAQMPETHSLFEKMKGESMIASCDNEEDKVSTTKTGDKNFWRNSILRREAQENNSKDSKEGWISYQKEMPRVQDRYTYDLTSVKEGKIIKVTDELITEFNSLPIQNEGNKWRIAQENNEKIQGELENPHIVGSGSNLDNIEKKDGKTLVGLPHQATIPSFRLNQTRKRSRKVRSVWRPDMINQRDLERMLICMEEVLGEKIMNQEKAVKMIFKSGMNIVSVRSEIERNKPFYRNYFKISQRVLRKRQVLVCMDKLRD